MKFTWLHISDLHANTGGQRYLYPLVRTSFFEDLTYLFDQTGPVDLVLFTGDLAYHGDGQEYECVEEVLGGICDKLKALGGREPVFMAVPGNHDLERPDSPAEIAALEEFCDSQEAQKRFWNEEGSPLRLIVSRMFRSYSAWLRTTRLPRAPALKTGLLPGDFTATFEKEGHRLGVVGLNTAFLHVGDTQKGKLAVDTCQLGHAAPGDYEEWFAQNEFSLLLTHHPDDWLADSARIQFKDLRPPGKFAAHLFGHLHEGGLTSLRSGGAELLNLFQGPSLFGLERFGSHDKRIHGYCIGQIDSGDKSLVFWPRNAIRMQMGGWEFAADLSVGLPSKTSERTGQIYLTGAIPPRKTKSGGLTIEQLSDARAQQDDLHAALQVYLHRIPPEERYAEATLVELIRRHLSGDFGPHRPSKYWRGHFLVAKYEDEVVGMLLWYDDLQAGFSFISYLAAKKPAIGKSNPNDIGRALFRELLPLRRGIANQGPLRILSEVDDPRKTNNPVERRRRLSRVRLFNTIAAYEGVQLRCIDMTFLQPKLNPWGKEPEEDLLLVYVADDLPTSLPRKDIAEIVEWTCTKLYAANISTDPVESREYEEYLQGLSRKVIQALPENVRLLRVEQL